MRISRILSVLATALCFRAAPVRAQQSTPPTEVTGRLDHLLLETRRGETRLEVYVAAADGTRTELRLDAAAERQARRLLGRRVRVGGTREGGRLRAKTMLALDGPRRDDAPAINARRFVTLLCRFPDVATVPYPPETYARWMGTGRPSMEEFWREVSDGRATVVGAGVHGWRTLPLHSDLYLYPLNARGLVDDCVAAHDPFVDFSQVDGINVQVNKVDNEKPSGAGFLTLTLEGRSRTVASVFLIGWATQGVYAHEIGHTFGLLHSFGANGVAYESPWDVMAIAGALNTETREVEAQHTLAFNKERLGWMDASRKVVPERATRRTVTLSRSALAGAGGALLVEIPVDSGFVSYTVEARKRAGYDRNLPGEAVILNRKHLADNGVPYARLVSRSATNSVASAMWRPGESFADSLLGVSISVLAETADGFTVEVRRGYELSLAVAGQGAVRAGDGAPCAAACATLFGERGTTVTLVAEPAPGWRFAGWTGACAGFGACALEMRRDRRVEARFTEGEVRVTVEAAAAHLLGRAQLTGEQAGWMDQRGNRNGRYDVGDFRAWLRRERPAVSAELRPLVERLAPGVTRAAP